MNLAINRTEQLLSLLLAIPTGEFATCEVYPLGATLRMSPLKVRQALSALEKADKLVRIQHGMYLTMQEYLRQGYRLPGD